MLKSQLVQTVKARMIDIPAKEVQVAPTGSTRHTPCASVVALRGQTVDAEALTAHRSA